MSVLDDNSIDLLGKNASDLMTDVVLEDNSLSGTVKYVDDYTGFSSNVSEQSGNYIALIAETDGTEPITAFINGGLNTEPVTLDDDGIFIARLIDTATSITFTTGETTKTIDVTNLTLASE